MYEGGRHARDDSYVHVGLFASLDVYAAATSCGYLVTFVACVRGQQPFMYRIILDAYQMLGRCATSHMHRPIFSHNSLILMTVTSN
jgi:hypothetical protein